MIPLDALHMMELKLIRLVPMQVPIGNYCKIIGLLRVLNNQSILTLISEMEWYQVRRKLCALLLSS